MAPDLPESYDDLPFLHLDASVGHLPLTPSTGEGKELATLERLLVDETDLQIRLTVVSAIGKHTGKEGKALLGKVQAQETNPVMQRELRKHL